MQAYLNIETLTSREPTDAQVRHAIDAFVGEFGWKPSFVMGEHGISRVTNANVLLEQGLEISAMVSFLRDRDFGSLSFTEMKNLLEISYNNIVDWHIFVDSRSINVVFNRNVNDVTFSTRISENNLDPLYYRNLESIINKTRRSEIDPLDLEIIANISRYRRLLHSEIENISTEDISSLMNAVILLRSMEDISKENFVRLHEEWFRAVEQHVPLSSFVEQQAKLRNNGNPVPDYLLSRESLEIFNSCSVDTIFNLLKSFYGNSQYKYDFSLMTRHALGKIYEKYVTELEIIKTTQIPLFEGLIMSSERRNYAGGTVYTPQYIATYFSKLAIEYIGSKGINSAKAIDPACGSGVFLRNYLENALESTLKKKDSVENIGIFKNVYGIDINKNAANASKLSLSLLSLSVFNQFPAELKIFDADTISTLPGFLEEFDLVFCNPPYESSDSLEVEEKANHMKVLKGIKTGTKFDSYLAFLILSIKSLKSDGYGFFVIPQTFLSNSFSEGVRKYISDNCYIHRIVDLSSINDVFSNVSTYVILLIIQKKGGKDKLNGLTQIVKARSFPGYALEYSLEMRPINNSFVEIFYRSEENFSNDWRLISAEEDNILQASENLISASQIFDIQQGVLSGADDIFILPDRHNLGDALTVRYLPDRGMSRYQIKVDNAKDMLYPYTASTALLSLSDIKLQSLPTLKYLESNKAQLIKRAEKDESNWWGFTRPRKRAYFERPKIITPNLVISPKFGLDIGDNLYVSRSTYLTIKDSIRNQAGNDIELQMLKFYLGILNSTIFYKRIEQSARKYRGSYIKIEVKTLKESLIPDFFNINPKVVQDMIAIVDRMIADGETEAGRDIVESLAARAYGVE